MNSLGESSATTMDIFRTVDFRTDQTFPVLLEHKVEHVRESRLIHPRTILAAPTPATPHIASRVSTTSGTLFASSRKSSPSWSVAMIAASKSDSVSAVHPLESMPWSRVIGKTGTWGS